MKTLKSLLILAVFAITALSQAQDIKPAEVKKIMKKVADWQIDHYRDNYSRDQPHRPDGLGPQWKPSE